MFPSFISMWSLGFALLLALWLKIWKPWVCPFLRLSFLLMEKQYKLSFLAFCYCSFMQEIFTDSLLFFFYFYILKKCWLCWVFVAACRLSCLVARGILILLPGVKLSSPALEERFLTTGPPPLGMSLESLLYARVSLVLGIQRPCPEGACLLGWKIDITQPTLGWIPLC